MIIEQYLDACSKGEILLVNELGETTNGCPIKIEKNLLKSIECFEFDSGYENYEVAEEFHRRAHVLKKNKLFNLPYKFCWVEDIYGEGFEGSDIIAGSRNIYILSDFDNCITFRLGNYLKSENAFIEYLNIAKITKDPDRDSFDFLAMSNTKIPDLRVRKMFGEAAMGIIKFIVNVNEPNVKKTMVPLARPARISNRRKITEFTYISGKLYGGNHRKIIVDPSPVGEHTVRGHIRTLRNGKKVWVREHKRGSGETKSVKRKGYRL